MHSNTCGERVLPTERTSPLVNTLGKSPLGRGRTGVLPTSWRAAVDEKNGVLRYCDSEEPGQSPLIVMTGCSKHRSRAEVIHSIRPD